LIVHLDYRKSFDSVNHAKLIKKLMIANDDPSVCRWIAAFLQGRRMRVKVRLEFSDCVLVFSGVPQDLYVRIGSLLFLIFIINDLPEWIKNSMLQLFADDTKVYRKILEDSDEISLQQNLDSLVSWTKEWCLQFNVGKCKVMNAAHILASISICLLKPNYKRYRYSKKRDLGIEVPSSLKPTLQCTGWPS